MSRSTSGSGILVAMIFSAGYGYANERIAYRRLRKAHVLAPLTSAIGISTFLQYFIFLTVSKEKVNFPRYYSDFLTGHHVHSRPAWTSPICNCDFRADPGHHGRRFFS